MTITYRDELGYITETVDEYGITSDGIYLYFNDNKISVSNIVAIQKGE